MNKTARSHPKLIDITGSVFGKLTVVCKAGNRKSGESKWMCVCECGGSTITTSSKLRKGHSKSCGCIVGEKHGLAGTPEYCTWQRMINRCYLESCKDYKDYGGRGIRVCDEWLNSFSAFLFDMGLRPSPKHSIDRIDNNGNYERENCRWATNVTQANNRRTNVVIEYNGQKLTAFEWSIITGIDQEQIAKRIGRGWTPERALTQPLRKRAQSCR
jgi:hypothetical protein